MSTRTRRLAGAASGLLALAVICVQTAAYADPKPCCKPPQVLGPPPPAPGQGCGWDGFNCVAGAGGCGGSVVGPPVKDGECATTRRPGPGECDDDGITQVIFVQTGTHQCQGQGADCGCKFVVNAGPPLPQTVPSCAGSGC